MVRPALSRKKINVIYSFLGGKKYAINSNISKLTVCYVMQPFQCTRMFMFMPKDTTGMLSRWYCSCYMCNWLGILHYLKNHLSSISGTCWIHNIYMHILKRITWDLEMTTRRHYKCSTIVDGHHGKQSSRDNTHSPQDKIYRLIWLSPESTVNSYVKVKPAEKTTAEYKFMLLYNIYITL